AIQALHHLYLARGYDLALAAYDFVDLAHCSPDDEDDDGQQGYPEQQPCASVAVLGSLPLRTARLGAAVRFAGKQRAHAARSVARVTWPWRRASTTCCLGPSATTWPWSTTI